MMHKLSEPEIVDMLSQRVLYNDGERNVHDDVYAHSDGLLAIDKPYGLSCTEGSRVSTHVDGLLPALRSRLCPSATFFERLHQLDMDTTGVLLFATDRLMHDNVKRAFAERRVHKEYMCMTAGCPNPKQGVFVCTLVSAHRSGYRQHQYAAHVHALAIWQRSAV
jgi:23S rRNA-/tRNA-specific pseudouridylate synthase